jgi:hypothetical protein
MQALKENELIIELSDIDVNSNLTVLETDVWSWEREYWLLSGTLEESDKISFELKKIEGTRLAIYVNSAQLICQNGMPLKPKWKNLRLLRGYGIEPRLILRRW